MKLEELKNIIGANAESIIASGLNLKKSGSRYKGQCPRGGHSKSDVAYEWFGDHFFCHDCRTTYDIIDFLREKEWSDWLVKLHELAGVDYSLPKFKPLKAVTKQVSVKGLEYLKSRGITQETITKYRVRCDEQWIYFNYATPDMKLVAVKMRGIDSKIFNAVKGGSSILFGLHLFNQQTTLIICEGEIDCLTMAEIGKNALDDYLITSLPNGAGSFRACYENCKFWIESFEKVIIIPDSDEAGEKFVKEAADLICEPELYRVKLPCKDVNEFYQDPEMNPNEILSKYISRLYPSVNAVDGAVKGREYNYKAYESGFFTLDNALAGLQEQWVTVLYGAEGEGKTTISRQILLALAKQNIKSFFFVGEGRWEKERDRIARLAYGEGGVEKRKNTAGNAVRFDVKREARDKFREEYGEMILFSDISLIRNKSEIFDELLLEMKKLVKHGVKVFIIDSLSVLEKSGKRDQWEMQKLITKELKRMADTYKLHIILVHHTNAKGAMSGLSDVRRWVDCVLLYRRVDEDMLSKIKVNEKLKENVSALVQIEKARDDGDKGLIMFMEWEGKTGSVVNRTDDIMAVDYAVKYSWTKYISRYEGDDVPDYNRQIGDRTE